MKNRNLSLLACIAVLALGACQSSSDTPTPPIAADAPPAVPAGAEDTCNASTHSALVGQDYKLAPKTPEGRVIRVVCSTCPMTMDFNAERLNVIYDQKTGAITRLTCG